MARPILILRVGSKFFGVDIEYAKSVIAPLPLTEMPKSPSYLVGVVNVRGSITPVMDLGARVDADAKEKRRICIVDAGSGPAGLLVDDVLEVADAESAKLTDEWFGQSSFVSSVARLRLVHFANDDDESIVLILDIPSLLSARIAA